MQFLAALAVAVLLASSAFAAAEHVVCVGDDGHVTVEGAIGGVCSDTPGAGLPRAPSGVEAHSGDTGHCGPCKDLPINVDDYSCHAVRETLAVACTHGSPAVSVTLKFGLNTDHIRARTPGTADVRSKIEAIVLRSVSLQI